MKTQSQVSVVELGAVELSIALSICKMNTETSAHLSSLDVGDFGLATLLLRF